MNDHRCTCGAYAVGSLIHTDQCCIRESERIDELSRFIQDELRESFKQFIGKPVAEDLKKTIEEMLLKQLEEFDLVYRSFLPEPEPGPILITIKGEAMRESHTCVWEDYEGITQRFQYCSICDAKRGGNA